MTVDQAPSQPGVPDFEMESGEPHVHCLMGGVWAYAERCGEPYLPLYGQRNAMGIVLEEEDEAKGFSSSLCHDDL